MSYKCYPILSYPILSYPILSHLILSYPILSYHISSHLILSHPILSYLILSYLISSYPISSYPILSYLTGKWKRLRCASRGTLCSQHRCIFSHIPPCSLPHLLSLFLLTLPSFFCFSLPLFPPFYHSQFLLLSLHLPPFLSLILLSPAWYSLIFTCLDCWYSREERETIEQYQ